MDLTLQTTFTTALSSVPPAQLPRGSSLQNSTRFVVQAVAVAALATVLTSTLSQGVREQQEAARASTSAPAQRYGLCETPSVAAQDNIPAAAQASLNNLPVEQQAAAKQRILAGLNVACQEILEGFELVYLITFFASVAALIIGAFLPGWPGKWGGRAAMRGQPMPSSGH